MSSLALISCLMPTHNRRAFVPRALACFQRQTYPHRELLLLDDGEDAVADLLPADDARINYVRGDPTHRQSTGEKLNTLGALAQGTLLCRWDDDDWYSRRRLQAQATALGDHALCGLSAVYCYVSATDETWLHHPHSLLDGTILFTRTRFAQRGFPDRSQGEGTRFILDTPATARVTLRDAALYVAWRHAENTTAWRPFPFWTKSPRSAAMVMRDD